MADDSDRRTYPRRSILTAAAVGGAAGLAGALSGDGQGGSIYGGKMALSQAYNVAGDLWIGPDSAKSNVSADSGRVYHATDTQVEYYGDSGSWTKLGVGSSSQPVPSVTTDDIEVTNYAKYADWILYDELTTIKAVNSNGKVEYTNDNEDTFKLINDITSDKGNTKHHFHLIGSGHKYATTLNLGEGMQVTGQGTRKTAIKQKDGANVDAIEYKPASSNEYFPYLANFEILGNKANNTSGDGLVVDDVNASPNDLHMYRVFFTNFPGHCANLNWAWGYKFQECLFELSDGDGLRLDLDGGGAIKQFHMTDCFFAQNNYGIQTVGSADNMQLCDWKVNLQANSQDNVYLNGGNLIRNNYFRFITWEAGGPNASDRSASDDGVEVGGGNATIEDNLMDIIAFNCGGYGFRRLSSVRDNIIRIMGSNNGSGLFPDSAPNARNIINGNSINNGAPPSGGLWNGQGATAYERGARVIDISASPQTIWYADRGGNWHPMESRGPLDLSSNNGLYDGEVVVADGTSSSASAGDLATWDAGNTQWNVFNAEATQ